MLVSKKPRLLVSKNTWREPKREQVEYGRVGCSVRNVLQDSKTRVVTAGNIDVSLIS